MATNDAGMLGKQTHYEFDYNPSLLFAIPRFSGRAELGISGALPFGGMDRWTAYELSWLNARGLPQVAMAEFDFVCTSPNIIESKSFKLYLNSLNQTRFQDERALLAVLKKDLAACSGAEVDVRLLPVSDHFLSLASNAICIDDWDVACEDYQPNALLLKCEPTLVEASVCSHVFRSLCPVTGQPDWATIYVRYKGQQIIESSLLQYIVSFRQHQGFHEQCIEQFFCDVMQQCQPQELSIYGRFLRRGGLDINPFRTTGTIDMPSWRNIRQ